MRYLHPVAARERFVASGCYRFVHDGRLMAKTEAWALHAHPDGEHFLRVDLDARAEEGRSILAEALLDARGGLARFDIRCENRSGEGGVRELRATYQFDGARLGAGYSVNGSERVYRELNLPPDTLVDIPLLIFRGRTITALARAPGELTVFAPLFDHAQLLPGALRRVASPVRFAGADEIAIGGRVFRVNRYRYLDRAAAYWIDERGVVLKRVSAYKRRETVVSVSDYAQPADFCFGERSPSHA